MPKLWVFRRVPELKNRTGFIHIADDALAARLLREGMATARIDVSKRIERAPLPGTPAAEPPPSDEPPPAPKRKRKASADG